MQHQEPPLLSSTTPPDEARERRQRKRMRMVMSFWAIIGGLVFVLFGRDWSINGIYAPYLGYALIAVGVLALLGVNVFRGGPLDQRRG